MVRPGTGHSAQTEGRLSGSRSDGWKVFVVDNNNPSSVVAEGTCADFSALR